MCVYTEIAIIIHEQADIFPHILRRMERQDSVNLSLFCTVTTGCCRKHAAQTWLSPTQSGFILYTISRLHKVEQHQNGHGIVMSLILDIICLINSNSHFGNVSIDITCKYALRMRVIQHTGWCAVNNFVLNVKEDNEDKINNCWISKKHCHPLYSSKWHECWTRWVGPTISSGLSYGINTLCSSVDSTLHRGSLLFSTAQSLKARKCFRLYYDLAMTSRTQCDAYKSIGSSWTTSPSAEA